MHLNRPEYDNYSPQFPELIPKSLQDAEEKLQRLIYEQEVWSVDTRTFLEGWWALFWSFPGLHPDGVDDWEPEFHRYQYLVAEAFRRNEAGQLSDSELYPAEAIHNRIWIEQLEVSKGKGTPIEEGDPRVVIRNLDGLYLARNGSGEIDWVPEKAKAFRYFRKADAVDSQVREVKRRYGEEWIVEVLERPRQG